MGYQEIVSSENPHKNWENRDKVGVFQNPKSIDVWIYGTELEFYGWNPSGC